MTQARNWKVPPVRLNAQVKGTFRFTFKDKPDQVVHWVGKPLPTANDAAGAVAKPRGQG